MVRVGPKQKFRIRCDRILSIRQISDFWKSAGFRRIRIWNPSHPYSKPKKCHWYVCVCVETFASDYGCWLCNLRCTRIHKVLNLCWCGAVDIPVWITTFRYVDLLRWCMLVTGCEPTAKFLTPMRFTSSDPRGRLSLPPGFCLQVVFATKMLKILHFFTWKFQKNFSRLPAPHLLITHPLVAVCLHLIFWPICNIM